MYSIYEIVASALFGFCVAFVMCFYLFNTDDSDPE